MKTLLMLAYISLSALSSTLLIGADIDFANGTWTHPNGTSTSGWDSGQTTGTTALPGGKTATVSVSFVGTAQPTGLNLNQISESYFEGFAFQQDGGSGTNSNSLSNYMRIDITFSDPVTLENFVINDIDAHEIVLVEGWNGSPGTPSSGVPATYALGDYLENFSLNGVAGVSTTSAAPEYTSLAPEANVGISFTTAIKGLSVYYGKKNMGSAGIITIGVEGNIKVSAGGTHLYFTYNLSNNEEFSRPVIFHNTLPEGLVFDPQYMELNGEFSGTPIEFSNGNRTASSQNLILHPGNNHLKLRTLETSQTGLIENVATMDPQHPQLAPIVQTCSITL
ncbi:MAG: hypothetical protein P1V20_29840 [Verrucomicrobiales bacterium]|nr:hypothetical protein [Verrucomicrobiales bacterium]